MPAFRFPEDDFRAMAVYLAALKTAPKPGAPVETFQALCARCHGEKGDGKGVTWLYLDPAPRDLTKAGFMTTKPRERFLHSIAEGVPGTSMPAWHAVLDNARAGALLDFVYASITSQAPREIKAHKVPASNPVAMSAESSARGEATFVKRCAGCHGRKADGKGPNSLDIVPRPRNLRNAGFVQAASHQRLFESILYGVQGTAMPAWIDYGLSQHDVGDIVNFIRSINPKSSGSQYASR
jgi:mono/diheme cytochrome c family protein